MPEPKSRLELAATTVQVLSVVVGVVISVLSWYSVQEKEAAAREKEAAARAIEAQQYRDQRDDIERERLASAAKSFLELRQKRYLEALESAAVLANPTVHSEREKASARMKFRDLYVAQLSMVEAREVEGQMVALARAVDPDVLEMTPGQAATYRLAHAIRDSLVKSWGVDQRIVRDDPSNSR